MLGTDLCWSAPEGYTLLLAPPTAPPTPPTLQPLARAGRVPSEAAAPAPFQTCPAARLRASSPPPHASTTPRCRRCPAGQRIYSPWSSRLQGWGQRLAARGRMRMAGRQRQRRWGRRRQHRPCRSQSRGRSRARGWRQGRRRRRRGHSCLGARLMQAWLTPTACSSNSSRLRCGPAPLQTCFPQRPRRHAGAVQCRRGWRLGWACAITPPTHPCGPLCQVRGWGWVGPACAMG